MERTQTLAATAAGIALIVAANILPLVVLGQFNPTTHLGDANFQQVLGVTKFTAALKFTGVVTASLSLLFFGIKSEREDGTVRGAAILAAALLVGLGLLH